ncbi:hypothetical protein LINPERHAP1_LOCUS30196, partial [Linum perenne]
CAGTVSPELRAPKSTYISGVLSSYSPDLLVRCLWLPQIYSFSFIDRPLRSIPSATVVLVAQLLLRISSQLHVRSAACARQETVREGISFVRATPGTSKSYLAKAVATEADSTFFSGLSGSIPDRYGNLKAIRRCFDKRIYIPLPDAKTKQYMFKVRHIHKSLGYILFWESYS